MPCGKDTPVPQGTNANYFLYVPVACTSFSCTRGNGHTCAARHKCQLFPICARCLYFFQLCPRQRIGRAPKAFGKSADFRLLIFRMERIAEPWIACFLGCLIPEACRKEANSPKSRPYIYFFPQDYFLYFVSGVILGYERSALGAFVRFFF